MILQQQIRVLPAGASFKVLDEHKPVIEGYISRVDKSACFENVMDAERYIKVYQTFHVELLDVHVTTDGVVFIINVR